MSEDPVRRLANAILEPSGDQAGSIWKNTELVLEASPAGGVSLRCPLPSEAMTKIA